MARCPSCPSRVCQAYKKVADSGDVVIYKRLFSIVDTHESAIAIVLSPLSVTGFHFDSSSYKNQIFLVGGHQGVRRFVSPGLHRIMSVSSHCGMSRNERFTSFGSCPLSPGTILCHQQAFRTTIYWDRYLSVARKRWRCEGGTGVRWGDPIRGTPCSCHYLRLY